MTRSSLMMVLSLWLPSAVMACGHDSGPLLQRDSAPEAADAGTAATRDDAAARETGSPLVPEADATRRDTAAPPDAGKRPDAARPLDSAAPDAAPCDPSLQGTYSAPFALTAVEKVGSIIVNEMACSGTLTAEIDCGQVPVLQGSYTCNYGGGLVVFDQQQSGAIQGNVGPGGAFAGDISHQFSSALQKSYSATGTVAGGTITGGGKGSLYPSPQSVVAWDVTFSI